MYEVAAVELDDTEADVSVGEEAEMFGMPPVFEGGGVISRERSAASDPVDDGTRRGLKVIDGEGETERGRLASREWAERRKAKRTSHLKRQGSVLVHQTSADAPSVSN